VRPTPLQRTRVKRKRSALFRTRLLGRLIASLLRALVLVVSCLPWELALVLGRRAGDLLYLLGVRHASISANLDLVYGDTISPERKRRIARSAQRNMAIGLLEVLRGMSPRALDAMRRLRIEDELSDALSRDVASHTHPSLMVLPHLGNFDLAGTWWCRRYGVVSHVVMKPPAMPEIFELLVRLRERFGLRVINTRSPRAIDEINETLAANKLLCMLPDQHAGNKKGVTVDFLGVPACTFRGPAIAALRTPNLRVYLAANWRVADDDRIVVRVRHIEPPPLTGDQVQDVHAWTQRMSDVMSEAIWEHPETYLWHHRRWRAKHGNAPQSAPDGSPATDLPSVGAGGNARARSTGIRT
jgi:KDO2-lipid IV(A) lauroyltransferase